VAASAFWQPRAWIKEEAVADPTSRLSTALADRHVIERELGQGGMANPTGRRAGGPAGRNSDV